MLIELAQKTKGQQFSTNKVLTPIIFQKYCRYYILMGSKNCKPFRLFDLDFNFWTLLFYFYLIFLCRQVKTRYLDFLFSFIVLNRGLLKSKKLYYRKVFCHNILAPWFFSIRRSRFVIRTQPNRHNRLAQTKLKDD